MRGHWLALVFLFVHLSFWCQGQTTALDSLKKVLATTPTEKKMEVLQAITIKLWLNYPDSAMKYAKQAIELSRNLDSRNKAIAVRLLGAVYYYKGQNDSTIKYSHKALKYLEESKDSFLITNSMNNLGLAFYSVGSYPEALSYLLKALYLKKKIKQEYGLSNSLNNVGLVYTELKEYTKARNYFNEAVELNQKSKNKDGLLYSYNNIASTYLKEKQFKEAEKYYKLSEELGQQTDNAVDESTTFTGLGEVALERNDFGHAWEYFLKALQLRKNLSELNGIAEIYSYLSVIHSKTGRSDSAFHYLNKSQKIAKQIHYKEQELSNYQAFSELYARLKKYDSAFSYQSKFVALRDSLFNKNLARNINDIQLQIQDEETRDKLIAKDKELNSRTNTAYFLAAIVVLSILSIIGAFRSLKRERAFKNDLTRKNAEIENQKEELLSSNQQLEEAHRLIIKQNSELEDFNQRLQLTVETRTLQLEKANEDLNVVNLELDNFIYKSSHDIKGPLVRLIGLCHVALLDVSDLTAREYLLRLNESAKNLSELFDRLRSVSEINTLDLKKESIDFHKIVDSVKSRLKNLEGFNEIDFKETFENVHFISDSFLVETIFTNMVENAIKFQKKSQGHLNLIEVRIEKTDNGVRISFIDNGIGIRETDHKHLFQMFSNAALEHKNIGLGLYIVKQCVAKLNGSIQLAHNENQFTQFDVVLPNANL